MPSITYDQIYSRFYLSVQAYDLIFNNMDDATVDDIMCSYLHSAVYYPMIRKLFNEIAMDDDEKAITYEMTYVVDDGSDKEFVLDILSSEMAVKWVTPKVANFSAIKQFFGTSESKFYSQAAHLEQLIALKDSMENHVRALIADRGGQYNTYLDGTSTAATMRSSS